MRTSTIALAITIVMREPVRAMTNLARPLGIAGVIGLSSMAAAETHIDLVVGLSKPVADEAWSHTGASPQVGVRAGYMTPKVGAALAIDRTAFQERGGDAFLPDRTRVLALVLVPAGSWVSLRLGAGVERDTRVVHHFGSGLSSVQEHTGAAFEAGLSAATTQGRLRFLIEVAIPIGGHRWPDSAWQGTVEVDLRLGIRFLP